MTQAQTVMVNIVILMPLPLVALVHITDKRKHCREPNSSKSANFRLFRKPRCGDETQKTRRIAERIGNDARFDFNANASREDARWMWIESRSESSELPYISRSSFLVRGMSTSTTTEAWPWESDQWARRAKTVCRALYFWSACASWDIGSQPSSSERSTIPLRSPTATTCRYTLVTLHCIALRRAAPHRTVPCRVYCVSTFVRNLTLHTQKQHYP